MHPVTERDRWLALGLLLAVLAAAYLVLVHPLWTRPMVEAGNAIEALQQRELRARMQLQQGESVGQHLAAAREMEARLPAFLPEPNAELATAGLARRLETVVGQASPGNRSCAISNRSPGSTRAGDDRFQRVVVRARLRCGNAELAEVLHALEGGHPTLFIENLHVMGLARYSRPGLDSRPAGGGLDVEFELHGFLLPSGVPGGNDAP